MLISVEKYNVGYLEDPLDRQIIYTTSVYAWGLVQNGIRNDLQHELQTMRHWIRWFVEQETNKGLVF